jgi:hypothetical protein
VDISHLWFLAFFGPENAQKSAKTSIYLRLFAFLHHLFAFFGGLFWVEIVAK